jgi:hypothetical protein
MFGNMPEVEDNFMINATHGMRSSNYKNKSSFAIASSFLAWQELEIGVGFPRVNSCSNN